jgi:hypothetical protein
MQSKLFVALQLKVGRARRVEDPGAFGATKTPKTFFVHPYKPAEHPSFRVGLRQSYSSSGECFGGRVLYILKPRLTLCHIEGPRTLAAGSATERPRTGGRIPIHCSRQRQ